jgi:hypothetical protein
LGRISNHHIFYDITIPLYTALRVLGTKTMKSGRRCWVVTGGNKD